MKVFIVAAVLAVAAGAPAPENPPSYRPAPAYKPAPYHPEPQYKEEPKPYAFDYAVKDGYSGADFAANENSDGKQTTGYYKVALPDGRIQTVKYVADHYNGFNAEVTYEGEAQYPEYHPAPAYKPAPYKPAPAPYKPAPAPYKPAPKYN
ncbi:Pro-resilin [Amphibalanus amphitrite]|uniref:Pro-resilin n=1 Tax=Amphibalanus amphitrite TaxID=1232801 RepID=A0A6A4W074_AMPAM|nr:cuticle protein 7-like [Amphibalanus amphitrite]XP_043225312.1 cuticle protein 7-like [Amphibalanus amphitrite]KAF0295508.1 Pro-resilin [Amphibalanus amphitrite]